MDFCDKCLAQASRDITTNKQRYQKDQTYRQQVDAEQIRIRLQSSASLERLESEQRDTYQSRLKKRRFF
jgi:hypothetical protein